jgi:hypothetical protein
MSQVDGIAIEYQETEGSTFVQAHGTTPDGNGNLDSGLQQANIPLTSTVLAGT